MRVKGKFKRTDHFFDVEIIGLDVVGSDTEPEAQLIEMELRIISRSGLVVSIPGVYTGPVRADNESSILAGLHDGLHNLIKIEEVTGLKPAPPDDPGVVY